MLLAGIFQVYVETRISYKITFIRLKFNVIFEERLKYFHMHFGDNTKDINKKIDGKTEGIKLLYVFTNKK